MIVVNPNKWDLRWMRIAEEFATWSKDRSRMTSAVIVDDRNAIVAVGYNGFPRGVNDDIDDRHKRPAKYRWVEHAERNAIYNAAAQGNSTLGTRMYLPWFPCSDCGRGIIQAGIEEIICYEPDWNDIKYGDDFKQVKEMLAEVNVSMLFIGTRTEPQKYV